jgi:serine protease
MKSVNPGLTPQDVDLLIAGSHPATAIRITDDLGSPGKDEVYGHGLINAVSALRAAGEIAGSSIFETPLIQVAPLVLDFGSDLVSAEVTVRNAGAGTLDVTSATSDEAWLTLTQAAGQDEVYDVHVSRDGLADGVYTAGIEIVSNGGTANLSVRMRVGEQQATGGDIGTVYILLLRADDFEVVAQYDATADDGYAFSFQGVPPGQYLLFAGTDMNNDSYIDDPGEGQGAYPTLAGPQALEVFQDRSGLSFNVGFSSYLQAQAAGTLDGSEVVREARLQRSAKRPSR